MGHSKLKEHILNTLILPRKYSDLYSKFHLPSTHGILLYGPPGTGKTYLISLIAQYLNYSFLNIKLSSIISGEIGSSEQKIRNIFQDAKRSIPCILFIDEFQALFPSSSNQDREHSTNTNTLITTLSGCIDEIQLYNQYCDLSSSSSSTSTSANSIVIIAATNEPWRVDKSFLRPGRFDQIIYVGLMNLQDRILLISQLLNNLIEKNYPHHALDPGLDIEQLANHLELYTTADICYVIIQLEKIMIKELLQNEDHEKEKQRIITQEHLNQILNHSIPSCTMEEIQEYLEWKEEMKHLNHF